jgi:hypothetical protein
MNLPQESQPRKRRYSVRLQARLDPETHATLDELAYSFYWPIASLGIRVHLKAFRGIRSS